MICNDGKMQGLLTAFAEGELPVALSRQVQEHIAQCEACRKEIQAIKKFVPVVKEYRSALFEQEKARAGPCPDRDTLRQFANEPGRMSLTLYKQVDAHRQSCPDCAAAIDIIKGVEAGFETDKPARVSRGALKRLRGLYRKEAFVTPTMRPGGAGPSILSVLRPQLATLFAELKDRVAAKTLRLTVTTPDRRTESFEFSSSIITIGRSRDNHLCLEADPDVAPHHAMIVYDKNNFFIYDLEDSGGTWLDRHRVLEHVLPPSGEIMVGNTIIKFEIES